MHALQNDVSFIFDCIYIWSITEHRKTEDTNTANTNRINSIPIVAHAKLAVISSRRQVLVYDIHRPQKIYEHWHQRRIRGKLHVERPISREPNIIGCWNFEWFYITWSFKRITHVSK